MSEDLSALRRDIDSIDDQILALLHPFMPHMTQKVWHMLGYEGDIGTVP